MRCLGKFGVPNPILKFETQLNQMQQWLQFSKNENKQDFSTCGQVFPVSNRLWRLRASYNIFSAESEFYVKYSNILCWRV